MICVRPNSGYNPKYREDGLYLYYSGYNSSRYAKDGLYPSYLQV